LRYDLSKEKRVEATKYFESSALIPSIKKFRAIFDKRNLFFLKLRELF